MARIALTISYNGCEFHGFQSQSSSLATIQNELESALSKVANHPVAIICAGRTDSGVHATHQVVHFDTRATRQLKAWIKGANSYLPDAIVVTSATEVAQDFHARFSATYRRYLYLIDNGPVRSSFLSKGITHETRPLDEKRMHEAAQALVGEHDFTSFRAASCQSNTPNRCIFSLNVLRAGSVVALDVTANAFLHHMVRNITDVLVKIGCGKAPVSWAHETLLKRDRTKAARTARPDGLYLVDVGYPDEFNLPKGPDLPHLYSLISLPSLPRYLPYP